MTAAAGVDVQPLLERGLKGPAIARELQRERSRAIALALQQADGQDEE